MSDEQLKPCPFCGGGAINVGINTVEGITSAYVYCDECNLSMHEQYDIGVASNRVQAVRAVMARWQSRTEASV